MRKLALLLAVAGLAAPALAAEPDDLAERTALAHQYAELTYLKQVTQDTVIKEIQTGWQSAHICTDDPCLKTLNKSIRDAVEIGYVDYEYDIIQLMAKRLTKDQLTAAVAFSRSPAGMAISAMGRTMSDDYAAINGAFSKGVSQSVFRTFCTQQAEACRRAMSQAAAETSRK